MNEADPPRLSRRDAMKWVLAATASGYLARQGLSGASSGPVAKGYGLDPDMTRTYAPGDLWPLTLDAGQRRTVAALADLIIPEDEQGPAASAVGVTEMIDEWVSAPYPPQRADRKVILAGLSWLDAESQKRYGLDFASGIQMQKAAIARDICHEPDAPAELKAGARFFRRFRSLASGAYYSTAPGMKDLGYRGNVPMGSWDGPPAEIVKQLGLEA